MKRIRCIMLPLVFILAFGPALLGSDLSTYRGFRLGAGVNAAVKHSGMDPSEVTVLHKRPALIQEMNWRPSRYAGTSGEKDPVDQIEFSFIDGQLFRIVVDYDSQKIVGLTTDDLIDGIAAQYGAAAKPGGTMALTSQYSDEAAQVLARWEDADYSFNLVQRPYSPSLKLVIFSKVLSARAEVAISEGVRLDKKEAPGLLKLEEEKAKTDLDRNRLVNKARFRP